MTNNIETIGFFNIPYWATKTLKENADLSHNQVYIFCYIFNWYRCGKRCYESSTTIAEKTAISEKSVRTTLKSLVDKGLLECESQALASGHKQNIYTVNPFKLKELVPSWQKVANNALPF